MRSPPTPRERGGLVPPVERSPRGLLRSSLRLLAAVVLVPNAAFWVIETVWALQRPAVNLDYALVALIHPWTGAVGTAVLTGGFALMDALVAGAYHYCGNPTCLLQAGADIVHLPLSYTLRFGIALLAGAAAVAWLVYVLTRTVPRRSGPNLLSAGAAVLLSLVLTPLFPGPKEDERAVTLGDFLDNSIVPAMALATEYRGLLDRPVPAATTPLFAAFAEGRPLPDRVVLIVLESWGVFRDPEVMAETTAALDSLALDSLYDVERGIVPEYGGTVRAELRELCRAHSATVRPDTALIPVEECLPALFGERGYTTIAMHGFRRNSFDREHWWPGLGFDSVFFRREMRAELRTDRTCGTVWEGVCDGDAGRFLEARLSGPPGDASRRFVYWLSLNAHPPYPDLPEGDPDMRRCRERLGAKSRPALCAFLAWHDPAMEAVARLVARDADGRTAWIVVGDHPPRFRSPALQESVVPDSVPWIRLWPRTR